MPIKKFVPRQPDPFIKKAADQEVAKFGHLNALLDILNNIAPGGIISIGSGTGITVDNTDPANPIVNFTGDSDDVDNNSGVTGVTVTEALDNIIAGLLPPGAVIIEVEAATTAPLAANTYANGAAGVNATITINANGAFPTIDLQTAVLNKIYLIKNETGANRYKNGIYRLSTLGTAGTQAVLTRHTGADTSSELTNLVAYCTYNTGTNRNKYFIQATDSPTVGTSPIIWGAPGAGANLNLTQVLTNGNDAGGLNIINLTLLESDNITIGDGVTGVIQDSAGNGITWDTAANGVTLFAGGEMSMSNAGGLIGVFGGGAVTIQTSASINLSVIAGAGDINFTTVAGDVDFSLVVGNVIFANGAQITSSGRVIAGTTIATANPGAGAGSWKLGTVVAGAVVMDAANYIEVDIGGTVKKILIAA